MTVAHTEGDTGELAPAQGADAVATGSSSPVGRFRDPEKAREAGLKSAQAARERKAREAEEAQAAQLHATMTVAGRLQTAQAEELDRTTLSAIHRKLATDAAAGKVEAARELRLWMGMGFALPDDGDEVDDLAPWAKMPAAQRAAFRAFAKQQAAEAAMLGAEAEGAPAPVTPPAPAPPRASESHARDTPGVSPESESGPPTS